MASIVCLFTSSSSPRPFKRRFLLDIVQAFPIPGNSLVKTYFELLLFTEVALHMKSPVNVVAFFPTWVRGALKKGIFLVTEARQEQIPLQLQQKRVKVCVYINRMCGSTCVNLPFTTDSYQNMKLLWPTFGQITEWKSNIVEPLLRTSG